MEALNSSSFEKSEVGVKDHTTGLLSLVIPPPFIADIHHIIIVLCIFLIDLSTVSELSVQQGTHPDDQVSSACISVSMQQASALESESFPLNPSGTQPGLRTHLFHRMQLPQ